MESQNWKLAAALGCVLALGACKADSSKKASDAPSKNQPQTAAKVVDKPTQPVVNPPAQVDMPAADVPDDPSTIDDPAEVDEPEEVPEADEPADMDEPMHDTE